MKNPHFSHCLPPNHQSRLKNPLTSHNSQPRPALLFRKETSVPPLPATSHQHEVYLQAGSAEGTLPRRPHLPNMRRASSRHRRGVQSWVTILLVQTQPLFKRRPHQQLDPRRHQRSHSLHKLLISLQSLPLPPLTSPSTVSTAPSSPSSRNFRPL